MKIRKAKLKDLNEIINLSKEWVKEGITLGAEPEKLRELKRWVKESVVLVATRQKEIIGYITGEIIKAERNIKVYGIKRDQRYTKLTTLYVLKEYRKKGVGETLIKHFLKECKNKPKPIILHASNIQVNKLVNFYKKFGFRTCYVAMKRR